MTAAARSNAFMTASAPAQNQALQSGGTTFGDSDTEAPPPLIPLGGSTSSSPARLVTLEPTLPGAAPDEPQVQVVRLHHQQASHPRKDHASAPVAVETKSHQQPQPRQSIPAAIVAREDPSWSSPPQQAAMEDSPRRLVSTIRCGAGSESCENCCHITAGVGVGLLCGSLGLWAFHCAYEVPFAIAGGAGVGAGICHWYAQQLSCIPECGAQWR